MVKKILIFGATGSIGSSLAYKLHKDKVECHLIARNEEELKKNSKWIKLYIFSMWCIKN